MKNIPLKIHYDKLELSPYWASRLKQAVRDSGKPLRAEINVLTAESRKQRKYLHGGLIPVYAYVNGLDWKDDKVLDWLFEVAKKEFTPEAIKVDGKVHVVGRSSKGGRALSELTDKLYDYLTEQYAVNPKAIDPNEYKRFQDEIYAIGEYDSFVDYCEKLGWLTR